MSEESSANSLSKVGVTVYRDERRLFLLRTVSFYMKSGEFGWKFKLICATSLGLFLLIYLMDLWSSEQDLWLPLGAVIFGTFILAGPVRWTLHKKLDEKNMKIISHLILSVFIVANVLLVISSVRWIQTVWKTYITIVVTGVIIGYGVVVLMEYVNIPDRVGKVNI